MKGKSLSFFSPKALLLLYHTVKYLRWQQVFYRLYYPFKRQIYFYIKNKSSFKPDVYFPSGSSFYVYSNDKDLYIPASQTFTFLHQTHCFESKINWRFEENGLLWSFHLHYFDWLNDDRISLESNLGSIFQYINNQDKSYLFIHSYPASIRIVNWIKFLLKNNRYDDAVIASLRSQAHRLYHFPEYDIMGNHLLQNGISLVWAGVFLKEKRIFRKGILILREQLKEQVLEDGVHFEKSFAYQSILVKSLMDLMVFIKPQNEFKNLFNEIKINVEIMLSTLSILVDKEGFYPNMNDSNKEMSICFFELMNVAQDLSICIKDVCFRESGFRLIGLDFDYTLLFNTGKIGANYQAGHAHADAFTFTLSVGSCPIIVDRGVSTYNDNEMRMLEKSTNAHNTLSINSADSAVLWSSFRMAKRPSIFCLSKALNIIDYKHDGYFYNYKIWHRRRIEHSEKGIQITDCLLGWKGQNAQLFYHFHPDILLERNEHGIRAHNMYLCFSNCSCSIEDYLFCEGFNLTRVAQRIVCIAEADVVITNIKFI
jgi:hypothetical protein